MKAAEAEMDAMRLELDRGAGHLKTATADLAACKDRYNQRGPICAPV